MLLVTQDLAELQEERRSLRRSSPDDTQRIQSIDDRMELLNTSLCALRNALGSLQVMDAVQPVRVLGIKCEGRTAVVMVYTLFLFLVWLLQYAFFGGTSSL
jgi:hypothetical protein